MKLAVTGCNGSVGKRVVRYALSTGHTVTGIDCTPLPESNLPYQSANNPSFSFLKVDLRDYNQTQEALRGAEAVVHLAAIRNPGDYVAETHNTFGHHVILY